MNTLEINDRREQLKVEARAMVATAKAEIRTLNDEEKSRMEAIRQELTTLNEELRSIADVVETPKDNNDININNRMKKNFSLLTAIRNAANNIAQDEISQAVINRGGEQMRHAGLSYVGQIQLPTAADLEERAVTVATEHDDVVEVGMYDVLQPLRAKNVLVKAGARMINGLVGDVQWPCLSAVNASWEGETATTSDTTPTFNSVVMRPLRMSVVVPISKQFILQDGVGAEAAIREEIVNAINAKIESTFFGTAAGTTTQPAGIFYSATTLPSVSDFEDLTALEASAEAANVYGDMKYIVSPSAKAKLRNMLKGVVSGTDSTINIGGCVYENNEIDGTPCLSTSHITNSKLVYGDFSNVIIGTWGNLDIVTDAYTLANQGLIRLVVNFYTNIKVLRPDALKVATVA